MENRTSKRGRVATAVKDAVYSGQASWRNTSPPLENKAVCSCQSSSWDKVHMGSHRPTYGSPTGSTAIHGPVHRRIYRVQRRQRLRKQAIQRRRDENQIPLCSDIKSRVFAISSQSPLPTPFAAPRKSGKVFADATVPSSTELASFQISHHLCT